MNHQELLNALSAKKTRAGELVKISDSRDLTGAELAEVKQMSFDIRKLDEEITNSTTSKAVADGRELLKRLGEGGLKSAGRDEHDWRPSGFTAGSGYLRLKSDAGATGKRLVDQIGRDGVGRKALVAGGSTATAVSFDMQPIQMGMPAQSIFDVLPAVRRDTPKYSYLRQTTRTNNAAVVAPGATKPTSIYTVTQVDSELSVLAHLSEPLDTYLIADNDALQSFIASELAYGLSLAVESKIVADVLATSGIGTQAFASDLFTTTRSAVTTLQNSGIDAAFWLMSADDWQSIELAKDTLGHYLLNAAGPVDVAGRRLWSAPVVISTAVESGDALLFGTGGCELSTDAGVALRWAEVNDDFEKNQVRARVEGRYATDVVRPFAVVNVALADDES